LNSAIRKYGKDNFIVELIETCAINEIDEKEVTNIKKFNTLNPNGYNLTTGGRYNYTCSSNNIKIDDQGKGNPNPRKRGVPLGYIRKKETIIKMNNPEKIDKQRIILTDYYSNNRAEKLANINVVFDENFKKHIRPHTKNNEIDDYVIRINRRRYCKLSNKNLTLEEKYNLLYDSLSKAYNIQQQRKINNN